jgi:uncharacterized protein (DUF3084 family)
MAEMANTIRDLRAEMAQMAERIRNLEAENIQLRAAVEQLRAADEQLREQHRTDIEWLEMEIGEITRNISSILE